MDEIDSPPWPLSVARAQAYEDEQKRLLLLENKVFAGLAGVPVSFDVASIRYFERDEFREVILRCGREGFYICGIEVCTAKGRLIYVHFGSDRSLDWALNVLTIYARRKTLLFTATYERCNTDTLI